jgi:hypothetical protein
VDDDTRSRAKNLADTMHMWLSMHISTLPLMHGVPADVVEWCRSARDILEQVAHDG